MSTDEYLYAEIRDRVQGLLEKIISEWVWYFSGDISANDCYKIVSSALKEQFEAEEQELKNIHAGEYIEIPDRITD